VSIAGRVKAGAADPSLNVPRRALVNLGSWLGALDRRARPVATPRAAVPSGLRLLGGLIVAVIAVAATMVLADALASDLAQRLPPGIIAGFDEITDFGKSGWTLWPLGLLLIALAALARPSLGPTSNQVAAAVAVRLLFIILAIGIPGLTVTIVKRLIGRVRPTGFDPFHYVPFSWRPDYASMPSGHSTAAFAAALAIGAVWPRARAPMWIYAGIIAVSRVIVSAHYPSDVVAGAFVGVISALLVRRWFARRGVAFAIGSDGRVHPLPGPSPHRLKRLVGRLLAPDSAVRS